MCESTAPAACACAGGGRVQGQERARDVARPDLDAAHGRVGQQRLRDRRQRDRVLHAQQPQRAPVQAHLPRRAVRGARQAGACAPGQPAAHGLAQALAPDEPKSCYALEQGIVRVAAKQRQAQHTRCTGR